MPVTVRSGNGLLISVDVGSSVGVKVGADVFVGAIVEVDVGLDVFVGTMGATVKVCVGRFEFGTHIVNVDGINFTNKTISTTRTVAMRKIMANMT